MLIFSEGKKLNVLLSLDRAETAIILLSTPAAMLHPDYAMQHALAQAVSRSMLTRGTVYLLVTADKSDESLCGFHGPLNTLPQPYRGRVTATLTAIAVLFQHVPYVDSVECLGEGALT